MILTLYLTLECNQRCKYCYVSPHRDINISDETAKKAIEIAGKLLHNNKEDVNLGIRFFGGEPLLVWNIIPLLVNFSEAIGEKYNLKTSYAIATNGTLLNEEHCDYFIEHDFAVGISIDGSKEVHDKNRGWINGTSSFSMIMNNIHLAVSKNLRMELVLVSDPSNIKDLPESIRYLHELSGAYFFTVSFNIHKDWSSKELNELEKAYNKIGDLYVEQFKKGKPIQIDFLNNKMNVLLRGGYKREFLCDIGKTDLAVTPEGDFYPCLRLAAMDSEGRTIIGNIQDGLYFEKIKILKNIVDKRFDIKELPKFCQSCLNTGTCLNWCAAANLAMTGNPAMVGKLMCTHERISIDVAKKTISRIDTDLYRQLYAEYFQPQTTQYLSPAIPHSELGLHLSRN